MAEPSVLFLAYRLFRGDPRLLNQVAALRSYRPGCKLTALGVYGQELGTIPSRVVCQNQTGASTGLGRLGAYLDLARAASAMLTLGRVSTIIATDPEILPFASFFSRLFGAKFVYDAHEFYEDTVGTDAARSAWVQARHRRYIPKAAAIFAPSRSISERYRQLYPGAGAYALFMNAVAKPKAVQPSDRLRQVSAAKTSDRVMVYHGGAGPGRGLGRLLDAFDQQVQSWKLVIVADNLAPELARRIADQDRVVNIPTVPQQELIDLLAGADAGVIPYEPICENHRFALPNKLWDFAAAGLPVFVADLPELTGLVSEYAMGVCLPDRADQWAQTMDAVPTEALRQMGERAAAFARDDQWQIQRKAFAQLVT